MKKQQFPLLMIITCIFFAFTVGILIGRNATHGSIQISQISTTPNHVDKLPTSPTPESTVYTEGISFPININTASKLELMELPGIGEVLADRILNYKVQNGHFSAPEELLNVSGIGGAKLEMILDLITTGGETP